MRAIRKPPLSAGVFSEGQLAIEVHALSRFKPGVFIRDALRSPLIFFAVVGGPPVMEVTVAVELPALIVEPMGQLVPNNRPMAAKFAASSACRSNSGGCRMAAGKVIELSCGS
jgi:hypothetical protein